MDLINLDSGQLFRLQPEYMLSQRDMERLFYFYAAQMFSFYRRNNHKRVRDFDRVEIFENSPEITCKPIRIPTLAATAAGLSYPAALAFSSIAANRLPLPNLGFLAILRPFYFFLEVFLEDFFFEPLQAILTPPLF